MSQPPNPPAGGTPQPPGEWSPQSGGDWQSDPTQQLPAQPQYPPTKPMPAQEPFPGGSGGYGQYPPSGQPGHGPGYGPGANAGGAGQYGAGGPSGQGQYGAGGQNGPAGQQYGQNQAGGQYGQNPAGGQYGAASGPGYSGPGQNGPGQYGQPGQYGGAPAQGGPGYAPPGQYGPPGGNFGAPPSGGFGGPPASGGGGRGRNPVPLIIGIVAGVVVLGLIGWFAFLRPTGTATPTPTPTLPSVTPSVLIPPSESPSASTSPSVRPSTTTTASCSPQLTGAQCDEAVYLRKFVLVDSCQPDPGDSQRNAVTCTANARNKLDGSATVTFRWAADSKDLTALMDDFFVRAGIPKNKIGKDWKKPPAHTDWWYTDTPKKVEGRLGSADATDGTGRVGWTFSKDLVFVEAVSDGDDADVMIDWWART